MKAITAARNLPFPGATVRSLSHAPARPPLASSNEVLGGESAIRILPGQYADKETDTNYNSFRDYDPATGRYAQSDPIGLVGGINTYAYASSDPIAKVDAQGLQTSGGGISPQQQRYFEKCLAEELIYCTIGTASVCAILCGAAATRGGVVAAIVVAGLCYPAVNHLCVNQKVKYCADKWLR